MAKSFDELGREIPAGHKVATPPHLARAISRHEEMKEFIRREMSRMAADAGHESFEEADDFDVDEDPDPVSVYELPEAPVEWPDGVKDVDADPPGVGGGAGGKNEPGGSKAVSDGVVDPHTLPLDLSGSRDGSGSKSVPAPPKG